MQRNILIENIKTSTVAVGDGDVLIKKHERKMIYQ